MRFLAAADTDIGTTKKINQDSVCVKIARSPAGQAALVLVCDGMGGLDKGELASATVIRQFSDWFHMEFPLLLPKWNWKLLTEEIQHLLSQVNRHIFEYGLHHQLLLGTTVTGMLFIEEQYLQFHIGDTRIYRLRDSIEQLTRDHSLVQHELERGLLTPEQAQQDPRSNILLKCVGTARRIAPEFQCGVLQAGEHYLFCSDGFRHVLTEQELYDALGPQALHTREQMKSQLRRMIELVKARGEHDNISAVLLRAEA